MLTRERRPMPARATTTIATRARQHWPTRMDPTRRGAPRGPPRVPLAAPDPIVPEIEEPEEADAVDIFGLLSVKARRDVLAGSVAGFSGGAI